ncbi:MAG: chromosome partitioning protein ParB, partial [Betaproteobacteria bacterium]|nr:chromosome partitioning protein ParB [Betaproteobacteria bacterium]
MSSNKQRPKGLGRGLDVLLGADPLQAQEGELRQLSLHKLQPGRYQPRTRMDEQALQELADSIQQHGIMQPILVRQLDNEYAALHRPEGSSRP